MLNEVVERFKAAEMGTTEDCEDLEALGLTELVNGLWFLSPTGLKLRQDMRFQQIWEALAHLGCSGILLELIWHLGSWFAIVFGTLALCGVYRSYVRRKRAVDGAYNTALVAKYYDKRST